MQSLLTLLLLAGLCSAQSFVVICRLLDERGLFSRGGVRMSPRQLPSPSTVDGDGPSSGENISIEYCSGCRWLLRSTWLAEELLTTFQDELDSVTLIPSRPPATGGIFRIERNGELVWDRKEEGGFPESKELKQRVRDLIAPERFLGHSDTATKQQTAADDCDECPKDGEEGPSEAEPNSPPVSFEGVSPNIAISYCTGCRWLLRAGWIAQELLTTFETELNSVTLIPSRPPRPGGTFLVELDGEKVLWDRSSMNRFPVLKELKRKVRDEIAPSHNLGHSDDGDHQQKPEGVSPLVQAIDDDEAEDLRTYFGVL